LLYVTGGGLFSTIRGEIATLAAQAVLQQATEMVE
jgi:hypothetical protein